MTDNDDEVSGDVSKFRKPSIPDEVLSALSGLLINTGQSAEDQATEDIEDLLDVMDEQYLRDISSVLNSIPGEDIIEGLLRYPSFLSAISVKLGLYAEILSHLDLDEE